jgi:hypothetical protein
MVMTTTYGNIIDDVASSLAGYTMRQDRATHLTADINSSAVSLPLAEVSNIGKGVIEIDEELLWLDSYDRISSTAAVPPYGRGYQGSTAAAHTSGTKVTIAPTFPRTTIKKAINDTIDAAFPNLFGVATHTFAFNSAKTTYSIPANVESILYISWQDVGPSGEWLPVKSWNHDPLANASTYATNNTVSLYDRQIIPGRTVQVYYTKKPATLSSVSDVFETTTGLPSSCKDVIVYGAAYRLASFIDPGRLNYQSADADQADSKIQYGSGASTARFLLALYQQRLTEESKKLRDQYPFRPHYTRY